MKTLRIICATILIGLSASPSAEDKMENTYVTWDDFKNNFGREMVSAESVFENIYKHDPLEFSMRTFDFDFVSDEKKKIERLEKFMKAHYPYTFKPIFERDDKLWELHGETNEFPLTKETLTYWALDMYKRGFEFDSALTGYGSLKPDSPRQPDFDKSKEDVYFDKGVDCYNAGDLSGAIANWTIVIKINPKDPNAYYSRAIVKNELHTWKAALQDYDKAISLAPNFISAILNRGSLKDENGDHKGAIDDYDFVLSNDKSDIDNKQKAYFNRGNSKYNLGKGAEACRDWKKALEMGAAYAKERIAKYCQ
jgi:tetratricopeptide (TPR) repeat protein